MYYDRKNSARRLEPGQKVSVLLPTTSNKLMAKWKGSFHVIKQITSVDYEIRINKKIRKTFHINMLKEWVERGSDLYSQNEIMNDENNVAYYYEAEKHSICNVVFDS